MEEFVNNIEWVYIKFPDFDAMAFLKYPGTTLTEYRKFLETTAGPEYIAWIWARGDRFARGVFIKDVEVATLFKLRYDLR